MSAIVAACAPEQLSERTRQWVSDATAYSAIAGPDGQAVALGRQWGLGHALLQSGRDGPEQPLTRDGRVWLAADARLDARAELISSLRAHGQAVEASSSDAELLLATYYAWGDKLLERVAGDFAFALWDDSRARLLWARDQLGIVPVHYARVGGELLVATALDALLLHPEVSDELDENAVADFLLLGHGDFAATTFQSIRRLPPAHEASWNDRGLSLRRYWRQDEWPPLARYQTTGEYVSRFRELLEMAVADRITDDRVAVHVTGGMDSTSVAAVAQRVMATRGLPNTALRGSTMVLGGDSGDQEGDYAKLVGRSLGIELEISDESLFRPCDPFADPLPPTPEPMTYRWTAMEYESTRRCAAHARTLLTGIPGDGLLAFVPSYWVGWLARGHWLRLLHALTDNARLFRARPHPHLMYSAGLLGAASRKPPAIPRWIAADFLRHTGVGPRMRRLQTVHSTRVGVQSLSRDPGWSFPFVWGTPAFHRLPLLIRHPFADLRLVDFASRLPPEPWLMRKRILREAGRDVLPEAVLARPKTGLRRRPRSSITAQALHRLAQFVRGMPEAERFFDPPAFIEALTAPDASESHPHNFPLLQALGLVHWRAHWRQPVITGVGSKGVRVKLDLTREGSDERFEAGGRVGFP